MTGPTQVASLYGKISADTGDLKRGLEEMKSGFKLVGSHMEKIGEITERAGKKMTLFVSTPIVAGLGKMVDSASDLFETMNKVDVVFGDAADEVKQFGADAAQSLGMSKQTAMEAAGTFGNLFTSMGLAKDQSADMSTELLTLAADLASFNNIDPTVALEKLRAGLVGEVEPLRTLGVNLSAAAVELKAVELGLIASGDEMTAAAKAQASFALIMEQTTNAQGDFARTSDGLANSTRILKAELSDAAAEMGQNLLPIALDLTQRVSGLVTKFSELEPEGQKTILMLAGVAAAMGPLLMITGKLITAIPILKGAMVALQAAGLGPLGIAVAAITAGFIAMGIAIAAEQDRMDEAQGSVLGLEDAYDKGIITQNEYRGVTMALMNGSMEAAEAQTWLATKVREYTASVSDSIPIQEDAVRNTRDAADAAYAHAAAMGEERDITAEMGTAIEEAANEIPPLQAAITALTDVFDGAKASASLLSEGIGIMSESMADAERVALVLEIAKIRNTIATENLTVAEKEQLAAMIEGKLDALDQMEAMTQLNQALDAGTISRYDWIGAMADGVVTQQEVNRLLGITDDEILDIREHASSVEGKYDIEFHISVTGDSIPSIPSTRYTGTSGIAFASGTENFTVPPGYPDDSFPVRLTSGESISVARPGESLDGGGGDTYYVTLNAGGNADGIELYRQFKQALEDDLRASERGGVQTSDY